MNLAATFHSHREVECLRGSLENVSTIPRALGHVLVQGGRTRRQWACPCGRAWRVLYNRERQGSRSLGNLMTHHFKGSLLKANHGELEPSGSCGGSRCCQRGLI